MFFFNLSFPEFMALFTAASGVVVALYLLNRARRKQKVATLRFWVKAERPTSSSHRRRIQQPWSLLLQIVSIALLLLALSQLRIGSPDTTSRDHVLILDTSAYTAAKGRRGVLLDDAKTAAHAYIRALPSTDRVMLVRADGLATPATAFETNRDVLGEAIQRSRPGANALNLDEALAFAAQASHLNGRRAGEIVYAGPARVLENEASLQQTAAIPGLRVLPVASNVENCGLRKIGLRRDPNDPGTWDIFVSARNYGTVARNVPLVLQFGGSPVATRTLHLSPGKEEDVSFEFKTRAAGWLEARLLIDDALPDDNRAILELPESRPLKVTVYSDQPELLKPILSSNPHVEAAYLPISKYESTGAGARIVILDRFRPNETPKTGSIWIQPPATGSPVPVKATVTNVPITRWRSDHSLGEGLRTRQLKIDSVEVFSAAKEDIPVAEVEAGPVVLARPGRHRTVVLGFHPSTTAMRYELATPLLFANLLRWLEPDVFRRQELIAGSAGVVSVPMESDAEQSQVRVITGDAQQLPFTVSNRTLRFFSGTPGTVRVLTSNREQVYSLTLPEIGTAVWQPPAGAKRGVPSRMDAPFVRDIWQWLAVLGALGLFGEFWIYGRRREQAVHTAGIHVRDPIRKAS